MSQYNIATLMDGEIDAFIDELALRQETERLSATGVDDEEE